MIATVLGFLAGFAYFMAQCFPMAALNPRLLSFMHSLYSQFASCSFIAAALGAGIHGVVARIRGSQKL